MTSTAVGKVIEYVGTSELLKTCFKNNL